MQKAIVEDYVRQTADTEMFHEPEKENAPPIQVLEEKYVSPLVQ